MRILYVAAFILFMSFLSCNVNRNTSYYTGDYQQDSIIRTIDAKFKNLDPIKTSKGKRFFGSDSIVYFSVNKATNQLQGVGFTEIKTDSRTAYWLINGILTKVFYIPNNRDRSVSTIYYYDDGNFVLKRERNANSPDPQKFLEDIRFFKKALGVR